MQFRVQHVFVLSALIAGGCAPEPDVGASSEAVIYGGDDRREVYEVDAAWQTLVRQSIVAMVFEADKLDTSNPADIQLRASSLADEMGLCADVAFRDQPSLADCSGTLIDDDLVLTAGHCVPMTGACTDRRLVFDYHYAAAGRLETMSTDDVYTCQRVLVNGLADSEVDYAIVQLDRRVSSDHVPAPVVAGSMTRAMGENVTLVGYGTGIPAKVESGGRVTHPGTTADLFEASLDAFGGHSGSGVFDSERRLVGILVGGAEDFEMRGDCAVYRTFAAGEVPPEGAEAVTYPRLAIERLCASGHSSARLCDSTGSCGNGTCDMGESPASCAADCSAPAMCGNGTCDAGENTVSCAADCPASGMPPAAWTCESEFYGAADGCDCDCGAVDPDCADATQEVLGCDVGQICSMGTCTGASAPVDAAVGSDAAIGTDAGVGTDAGGSTMGGSGCSVGGGRSAALGWGLVSLFGLFVVRRRR